MDKAAIIQALTALLKRPASSHKYDFGHVLVVGGSPGMRGAPLLAARATLRTGAGLVTVASEVTNLPQEQATEVMTYALPSGYTAKTLEDILSFIDKRRVTMLVIGPGLPMDSASLVRQLVAKISLPAVLDAGALGAFTGHLLELAKAGKRNPRLILTPHTGEFRRLAGSEVPSSPSGRRTVASDFAKQHNVTLVLKGHATVVASPGSGQVYQNSTGNPGMATAGTGDVLAGIIAGLCAQQLEPFRAAAAGVYLHGLAGDLAAKVQTQPALIASDLIDYLPAAFRSLGR